MSASLIGGAILWLVLLYPVWSPRCRRFRRRQEQARRKVSRNHKDGLAWEQDTVWPEVFEEE